MKLKTFLAPLALTALMTAPSFAGERGGNGGDGIEIDGNLYSLDLVEAGLERGAHFMEDAVVTNALRQRLERKFPSSDYPTALIVSKIAELERIDPVFARVLVKGMELYSWRLVAHNLMNVNDENTLLDGANLVQLAIRRNSTILIDRQHWQRLDETNRAALVFHEILYAFVKPDNGVQDSVAARELTGYLFSAELSQRRREGMMQHMANRFSYHQYFVLYYNKVMDNGEYIQFNPQLTMSLENRFESFGQYVSEDRERQGVGMGGPSNFCDYAQATPGTQYAVLAEQEMHVEVSLVRENESTHAAVNIQPFTHRYTIAIQESADCAQRLYNQFTGRARYFTEVYNLEN